MVKNLKILHGYGASIVVRERQRRLHGEGRQLLRAKIEVD